MKLSLIGGVLLSASVAAAQVEVHGVRAGGEIVRLDLATGTAYPISSTGVATAHGWTSYWSDGGQSSSAQGAIVMTGTGENADKLYFVRLGLLPVTGQPAPIEPSTMTGLPAGYTMAGAPSSTSFLPVLLVSSEPGQPELLASIDPGGVLTVVGSTGRSDLTAFTATASGQLFALSGEGGGALYSINAATGAATLIGGQGTYGPDTRALAAMPDGTLLAAGEGLRSVNAATGVATLIGPTGFTDIVGLSSATDLCYPNCDGGGIPVLNVADFTCFLFRFAAGTYYANCDRSTAAPTLNVADFSCFLSRFSAGCQ
jgi:hypothetical protein